MTSPAVAPTRIARRKLIEAHQTVTELVLPGFMVEGLPGWKGTLE